MYGAKYVTKELNRFIDKNLSKILSIGKLNSHDYIYIGVFYDKNSPVFLCNKCGYSVNYHMENGLLFVRYKDDSWRLADQLSILSCDECVVKDIIE